MQSPLEHLYTTQQFESLGGEQKEALQAVAEYLTGSPLPQDLASEELSSTFNLLRPVAGCLPAEEVDDNLAKSIRRKFCSVFQVGLELAEAELKRQQFKEPDHYSFCLLVEADWEDATHVVILDYRKPVLYLHEWRKAWHFQFETLAQLADEVLRVKNLLVQQVIANAEKRTLHVVLEGGLVREVVGLPDGFEITVVDYDVEDADPQDLQVSPLDGELCHMTHF